MEELLFFSCTHLMEELLSAWCISTVATFASMWACRVRRVAKQSRWSKHRGLLNIFSHCGQPSESAFEILTVNYRSGPYFSTIDEPTTTWSYTGLVQSLPFLKKELICTRWHTARGSNQTLRTRPDHQWMCGGRDSSGPMKPTLCIVRTSGTCRSADRRQLPAASRSPRFRRPAGAITRKGHNCIGP